MQVGLTIEKYKGIEPSVLIAFVKRMGVEFIEITKSVFEDLDRVIPLMKELKASFHLPLVHDDGYDFSCPDFKAEIDQVINLVNTYWRDLNIVYCIAHPPEPSHSKTPLRTSLPFLWENLKKLTPPVLLENVTNPDGEGFEEFYRESKRALGDKLGGFCFDAAHSFINNPGDWLAPLIRFNNELKHVHLSDCTKTKDLHMAFGLGGELPVDEVLDFLKKQRFDGVINLELMPQSLDDLKPVIDSYLMVLKRFRKRKYLLTRAKLLLIMPLIQRLLP